MAERSEDVSASAAFIRSPFKRPKKVAQPLEKPGPKPSTPPPGKATPTATLRHYEVMVILDPSLEERTISPSLNAFLSVVENAGGSVENVDIWGRRRLAYEIDKHAEGFYAVIDLLAQPAAVQELDRQLNLNEAVLRTKVLRPEER